MQINGAAEVTLYWSVAGALAMNKLGARVVGNITFDQALANTVGAAIKAAATSNLVALLGNNVALARVGVRDLRTDNQAEYRDTGATVIGTNATGTLPLATALCITSRTAKSGKSFRGRTYLPGFAEDQNEAGATIAPAAATAAVTFMQAVQNGMRSAGLELGVLTRPTEETIITETTNHNDGTTTVRTLSRESAKVGAVTDITAFESRTSQWESQRRRANSRGVPVGLFTPVARITADGQLERFDTAPLPRIQNDPLRKRSTSG